MRKHSSPDPDNTSAKGAKKRSAKSAGTGTSFAEKCSILGDLWLFFRAEASSNEAWEEFFSVNDIALPLCHMIDDGLAQPSEDGRAQEFINETWEVFCVYIDIDPNGHYQNLQAAFEASKLPPLHPAKDAK